MPGRIAACSESCRAQTEQAAKAADPGHDVGKEWFERVVDAFNGGGYEEAVKAFLADEAEAEGLTDD